jgi:hypothetical protein
MSWSEMAPTTHYHCDDLNAIAKYRVRGSNDAARIFAHRLAVKMFGRAGRCLAIERVRHGWRWVQYSAEIGRLNGPTAPTMLLVTER